MSEKIYDEASAVTAEKGVVYVNGPDGVAVALTPEAAVETSDRLLEQGTTALRQKVQAAHEAESKKEQ